MSGQCINEGCFKDRHPIGNGRTRAVCYRCYGAQRKKWDYNPGVKPFVKKDYCENIDGRLGYKCTATIIDKCQIDMDHIDGENNNNQKSNIQSLCSNCHRYKSTYLPRHIMEEAKKQMEEEKKEKIA